MAVAGTGTQLATLPVDSPPSTPTLPGLTPAWFGDAAPARRVANHGLFAVALTTYVMARRRAWLDGRD